MKMDDEKSLKSMTDEELDEMAADIALGDSLECGRAARLLDAVRSLKKMVETTTQRTLKLRRLADKNLDRRRVGETEESRQDLYMSDVTCGNADDSYAFGVADGCDQVARKLLDVLGDGDDQ